MARERLGAILPQRKKDRREAEHLPQSSVSSVPVGPFDGPVHEGGRMILVPPNVHREVLYLFLPVSSIRRSVCWHDQQSSRLRGRVLPEIRARALRSHRPDSRRRSDDPEDIFIGFRWNAGYRNVSRKTSTRTVEPEVHRLPRQIYL